MNGKITSSVKIKEGMSTEFKFFLNCWNNILCKYNDSMFMLKLGRVTIRVGPISYDQVLPLSRKDLEYIAEAVDYEYRKYHLVTKMTLLVVELTDGNFDTAGIAEATNDVIVEKWKGEDIDEFCAGNISAVIYTYLVKRRSTPGYVFTNFKYAHFVCIEEALNLDRSRNVKISSDEYDILMKIYITTAAENITASIFLMRDMSHDQFKTDIRKKIEAYYDSKNKEEIVSVCTHNMMEDDDLPDLMEAFGTPDLMEAGSNDDLPESIDTSDLTEIWSDDDLPDIPDLMEAVGTPDLMKDDIETMVNIETESDEDIVVNCMT
jgi:hypothetical protein